ncbi:MAG: NAD(P)-dependent alcohol dehydrogenase [Asgard group archaeon]|nr:NAD(P)-dependent alcohol dehydrogenase [Asgard group archaeon]
MKYGPPEVLQIKEIAKPTPESNELLIKILATTVTAGDTRMRSGSVNFLMKFPFKLMFGWKKPKHLGFEFAGEIEQVGSDVKLFKNGDQIFGTTAGLNISTYAEYISIPEEWKGGLLGNRLLAKKPANISFEEAAAVPIGGMTALYILQKGKVQKGDKILIYGASGSVGTYAVQLAKNLNADVTGVCSTSNLELVKSIGADHVIDYTKEDLSKIKEKYDYVFDAVGKMSKSAYKNLLKENGFFLSVKHPTKTNPENFNYLVTILKAGKLKVIIDRKYPLEKISEAHSYVQKGHKKGNVVITMNQKNTPK